MLSGERVILRFPEKDDTEILSAWQKDREVAGFLPFSFTFSFKALDNFVSGLKRDRSRFVFIIETEDEIPIGICSLNNIDWINGTASLDIVIYAKNCWGKGYGCDAVRVLTAFGLDEVNLYTISTAIPEDNKKAIKCFENAGYLVEGTLQNRVNIKGCRKNLISLSISKESKREV